MLLGIPGDNTYSNYAEANRAFYRQTVVPLVTRLASALGHWLGESFGGGLRLAPDLDEVPAPSMEREALWKRVGEASFLTDDEKRAAAGYEPLPASFAPSSLATLRAKFDPNQPRVPAGNSDGGQWTDGGYAGTAANTDEGRVLTDENTDEHLYVLGEQYAANKRRRGGHHYVPGEIYRDPNISSEAREVFREGETGKLLSGPHRWSEEHFEYNEAAKEHLSRFLDASGRSRGDMTRESAENFSRQILNSKDPKIRDFNMKIHILEIIIQLLLRGRGGPRR